MKITNTIKENKILAVLIFMTTMGVLTFDIFHYSKAYGIVEINNVNSLFLIPFITLICGLGILLGTTKQQDDFESNYQKRLTQREKEVIDLIIQGKKNKEIAEELFIDISTVKSHVNKIYKKTGVKNRKGFLEISKTVLYKG